MWYSTLRTIPASGSEDLVNSLFSDCGQNEDISVHITLHVQQCTKSYIIEDNLGAIAYFL